MKQFPFITVISFVFLVFLCTCLSSAVEQDATKEQVVLGTKYTIHSEILGDDRSFIVNLPEGYKSTELRYPVLYILDAEYFQRHPAPPGDGLAWYLELSWQKPIPESTADNLPDGDASWELEQEHIRASAQWARQNLSHVLSN